MIPTTDSPNLNAVLRQGLSTEIDVDGQVVSARLVRNKVDQGKPGRHAILVDGVTRVELVISIGSKVNDLTLVARSKELGHDDGRVVDRSSCPLVT